LTSSAVPAQIEYLRTQPLARLATIRPDGSPQNNPVGFRYNEALGTIDIAGYNMGATQKFRNLAKEERVSFVVDDIKSATPWEVRCLEIRGTAEALRDIDTNIPGTSPELIRITPLRILAFGIE
jgi:pyridoxamine 5'-phosphate oxidase family protein